MSQSYELHEQSSEENEIRSERADLVGDMRPGNSYQAAKKEWGKLKPGNEGLASKEGTSPSLHTEQFEMF